MCIDGEFLVVFMYIQYFRIYLRAISYSERHGILGELNHQKRDVASTYKLLVNPQILRNCGYPR
jgi:hypothetical protein